jgi:hypothetical protein
MISEPTKPRRIIILSQDGRIRGENHTKWDLELRRELNLLADLNYTILIHVIQEALEMEDEDGRKRLDEHLLARLAKARRTELHRL